MNTYLIPVAERHQPNFTNIVVIYANTQEEAYYETIEFEGFEPISVQKYTDVPYTCFPGKLNFPANIFPNYEPIYAYGELYKNPSENTAKWYFKGFKDTYELESLDIERFPERADYFSDPSRLVFNWHLTVNKNYKHILDDLNTSQRLPDSIKNSDRPLETLKGVIDTAIQKVIANYKLAVPHYYQNKIQLLVPLCFGKDDNPDVALVLDLMKNGYYQATTCLSMEIAYMDARLIAKPESNWLAAESIK